MSPSSDDESILNVPAPLQFLYNWWKGLLVPATIVAAIAAYFLGADVGWVVAALSIGFVVVFHVMIFFLRRYLQAAVLAEKFLAAQDPEPDERDKALRAVHSATRTANILFSFLFLVAAVAIVLLSYQPVYRLLRTKAPQTVGFESVRYFDPTRDSGLFQQSPFLEAVTTYLKDEAKSEDRNTRILLGTTTAFAHPTPGVTISVAVDDPAHVITGYAFRLHRTQKALFYEPVPLRYSPSGPAGFSLPPCDAGDQVFFVGRISLPNKTDPFPEDLKNVMKFSVEANK